MKIHQIKQKLYNDWLEDEVETFYEILEDYLLSGDIKHDIIWKRDINGDFREINYKLIKNNINMTYMRNIILDYIGKDYQLVKITKKIAQEIYNKVKK